MIFVPAPETPTVRVAEQLPDAALPAAREYFSRISAAFEDAVAKTSDIRRYFRLGPEVLCLRFAGEALVPALTEALRHNEIPPAPASLTICCRDSVSTATPMPPPSWPEQNYGAKGHVWGFNDLSLRTTYQPWTRIFNMLDLASGTGFYWISDPALLPYWECSFPLRGLIHWWCRPYPLQLVHAGAVGMKSGGVLLAGKSGSGKSTTALACLRSPLFYAGDDYVLAAARAEPYVYGLYNTAKMVPDSMGMFPELKEKIMNRERLADEKAMLFLNRHFPEKVAAGFPIRAIFLPRVTGEKDTVLRPAKRSKALLALAPTTIIKHLEGDIREAMGKMARLAGSVPCYWLDLGTQLEQVPEKIQHFLEEAHE